MPPNLENLRKRAKQIVRQHASGHVPVAERIRRGLPAFAGCSDREVLAAAFRLGDAQQLLAREQGFESWPALKRGIETMTPTHDPASGTPTANAFSRVHPQIFVTDWERAVAFYRDTLGFTVAYQWGEPPFYGLVERGGIGLNLRHVDETPFDLEACAREELLAAAIVVEDAKALYLEFRDAGAPMLRSLTEQPWGARDFVVTDPDGNQLQFTSPAEGG